MMCTGLLKIGSEIFKEDLTMLNFSEILLLVLIGHGNIQEFWLKPKFK